MKQLYPLAALLLLSPTSHAVDFNKDALKKLQEEGAKVAAQAKGPQTFKITDKLCLAGNNDILSVEKCKDNDKKQHWKTDDKGRLVAHDGRCIANNKLQKCDSSKKQVWQQDSKGRLVNKAKRCLQVKSEPPKAGSKVVTTTCSGSSNQVWS